MLVGKSMAATSMSLLAAGALNSWHRQDVARFGDEAPAECLQMMMIVFGDRQLPGLSDQLIWDLDCKPQAVYEELVRRGAVPLVGSHATSRRVPALCTLGVEQELT